MKPGFLWSSVARDRSRARLDVRIRARQLSMFPWLLAAVLDWFVIAVAMAACWRFPIWYVYLVASLVIGNRQHALGILGHDGGHRLVSSVRPVNDLLTNLFVFWPLLVDIHAYRRFHFSHHRNLGTTADPELQWKGVMPGAEPPLTPGRIVRYFLLDLCGLGMIENRWFLKHYRPDFKKPMIFWLLIIFLAWFNGGLALVALWHCSFATTFWAWFRLRVYTEHWGISGTHRFRARWWQRLFCPHNTWCHWEHHLDPLVPFWRLPQLAAQVK